MSYDKSIDMRAFRVIEKEDNVSFDHDKIIISSTHSVFVRGQMRKNLPYQGIARNPEFFMISVVPKDLADPKCIFEPVK